MDDVFTYMLGGEAGQGVKKAGDVASDLFTEMKRNVFQMDDYQSLIRGGHNFSVVSSSTDDISSHYMQADLVINLDDRSYGKHEDDVSDDGLIVYNSDKTEEGDGIGLPFTSTAKKYERSNLILGVGGIAVLFAALGKKKEKMKDFVEREYPRGTEDNVAYAEEIFDLAVEKIDETSELEEGDFEGSKFTGNQALALGAASAGLDMYIGYPMTPASSILHFFAGHEDDLGVVSIHPENEIGVANMAIGATMPGARTMVGTSGGGQALMEEAFSLAGMVESPVLFVLASRPGPSTGVPTYTEQGDLNFALNQGHGEFPKVVASPGSVEGAFSLAAEMLEILWKFQTPGIFLTEKHLSESAMSVNLDAEETRWAEPVMDESEEFKRYKITEDGVSPLKFPPSEDTIKWNSYESDERGITTEEPEMVTDMHDKRRRKKESILRYMKERETVNRYGDGKATIFTYGSTTMSVLEALRAGDIDVEVVQPMYLEPFPIWEMEDYMDEDVIVVEESSTGQFAQLLREKANIVPKTVIRRYDGRPFEPKELAEEIKEVL